MPKNYSWYNIFPAWECKQSSQLLVPNFPRMKSGNIQYIEERLSQVNSNTFLHHCDVLIVKSDSHLPKRIFLFASMIITFKNDEISFLCHLKIYCSSQDIEMIELTFWPCRKNGLIRKIRLISKIVTSQPG